MTPRKGSITMAINTKDYRKTKQMGLKQHKKDKTHYLIDITFMGKRKKKQIVANSFMDAYKALEHFKNELERQRATNVNLKATVNDYWKVVQIDANWKDSIKRNYNYYYEKHLKHLLGNIAIVDLKPATLSTLNSNLRHLKTRSRRKAYEILNPIIARAIEDELISVSPIKKHHVPVRKASEEKKFITDAENKYYLVHKAIHEVFPDRPDLKAIFLFGFHGRRVGETVQLKWNDIIFNDNTYLIRAEHSKVNEDMIFTLPEEIKDALLEISDAKLNSNDDVFKIKNVTRYYKVIREHTGIDEYEFHWMRNLLASALASQGVEAIHLSAILGHNDPNTIKKYLSLQRTSSSTVANNASSNLLEKIRIDNFFRSVAEQN